MSRPRLLTLLLLCIAPLASSCGAPEAPSRPPNIVMIVLDDLHYEDLGTYGNELIETPNFDRIAQQGIRFTHHYAAGPVCTPSRAGLLSGRYPHRFNLKTVNPKYPRSDSSPSRRGLPGRVTTIAELLKDRGYATAQVGKWHVGHARAEYNPTSQGFDHSVIGQRTESLVVIDDRDTRPTEGSFPDLFTDYALDFVRSSSDRPFFLNLWYIAPHLPLEPVPRWASRYPQDELGAFAAVVSQVDENVGRLLATLEELELADNTLVLATSDNGGVAKTRATSSLRGYKGTTFEGGLRVPLIARWPERIPAGASSSTVTTGLDLLPTLADLLEIDVSELALDGTSFKESLLGGSQQLNRSLFWEYGSAARPDDRDAYAVRRGDWKLVFDKHRHWLFDLRNDSQETNDLSATRPELVRELLGEYTRWRWDDRRMGYSVAGASEGVRIEHGADGDSIVGADLPEGGSIRLDSDSLYDFHDGDFSVSFWLRLKEPTSELELIHQPGSWSLRVDADRTVELSVPGDRSGQAELVSTSPLATGVWHHLVFSVYGRPQRPSLVRLLLDGDLQAEERSLPTVATTTDGLVIGDPEGGSGAEIGDLRLHLMALSEEEARQVFTRGPEGHGER